jgi:hypothetical protein
VKTIKYNQDRDFHQIFSDDSNDDKPAMQVRQAAEDQQRRGGYGIDKGDL